ncbi:MAG: AMP-binding protein, partial [Jatrophihabitantaceae bacterium]
TTVWSNDYVIGEVDPAWVSIPYGRPMPNSQYYVLDADLTVAPIGQAGDLYIAGVCLAQGYHNDPVRTDASFVADVVSGSGRMYRTGDRARWGADGELEFLGRLDQQVKIRGYRVELEEIETIIARQLGVRGAVVVAVPAGGDRQLAAYYLADGPSPTPEEVREACRLRLPGYSVPRYVRQIAAMPLTGNGKVDRAGLTELARAWVGQEST